VSLSFLRCAVVDRSRVRLSFFRSYGKKYYGDLQVSKLIPSPYPSTSATPTASSLYTAYQKDFKRYLAKKKPRRAPRQTKLRDSERQFFITRRRHQKRAKDAWVKSVAAKVKSGSS